MSNIRQYLRNKKNNEKNKKFEEEIAKHKLKKNIMIAICVVIVIIIAIVVKIYLDNRTFEEYEVSKTLKFDNINNSKYYKFGKCLLVYSDDGISYIEDDVTIWNQAFEMKNPILDICGDFVAVSEISSNTVYIYDVDGMQGKIETAYPVIDLEVSEQGVVAAITQDSETNRIEVIDKEGNSIATGQTYLTGEGCPIDISISNDGTKLAASYIYLDGAEAKSKVVFYNYSEVGKNEVGRIVGGFNHYENTIVTKVEFIDNETVVAFGDNIFTLYSIKQKPSMVEEVKIDKKIKSIFYDKENFGMVLSTDDYEEPYLIKVYNSKGKEKLSKKINFQYTSIELREDLIVLNNSTNLQLLSLSGLERYSGKIEEGLSQVITTDKDNKYYIINSEKKIMKVILK